MKPNDAHRGLFDAARLPAWICLFLAIATLSIYWPVKDYEFVSYDDPLYVSDNRQVQKGLTVETVIWSFTEATRKTNYWAPLTWLSILLDYQLYGMNAGGYHLTNVILHILNTLLVFIVFRRMTGAIWKSAFVAALFALHPLHVESVAWVTERKDVLSTFFWLLTMLSYAGYIQHPGGRRYLLTLFLFILGMMAKPMLVTLPFVLLLLDYWPLGRMQTGCVFPNSPQPAIVPRLIWEKAPFFIIIVIVAVATFLTQQEAGAVKSLASYPLGVRIANALVSYAGYIGQMFWPARLSFLYPHPGALPTWQWGGALLILGAVTYGVFRYAKLRPYLTVGWLWYLGTLFPVNGLVVIGPHAMADRYTYVPLIGLFVMLSWGACDYLKGRRFGRTVTLASASVMLVFLMTLSWLQVRYWQNSMTLFERALEVTENNFVVYNNLGVVLQEKGKTAEAVNIFRKALLIKPDYVAAHLNLGILLKHMGKPDEAVDHFNTALKIDPEFKGAHLNLGLAMAEQGKPEAAIHHYRAAIQIDPNYAHAHNNLANILEGQGKFKEATQLYEKALRIDPEYKEAHYNLGSVLFAQGQINRAIRHYREALRIDPLYAAAHNNLGAVLAQQGLTADAIVHFRAALQIAPDHLDAQNNLKKMLADQEAMNNAVLNILAAIAKNPMDADAHYALGRIYKHSGELQKAQVQIQKALSIHPGDYDLLKDMAVISAMQGRYDSAREFFQRCIGLQPNQGEAYYYIAGTYARQKRIEESVQWLQKAIEKGFSNWDLIKTDQNLERIRTTSYYIELMRGR